MVIKQFGPHLWGITNTNNGYRVSVAPFGKGWISKDVATIKEAARWAQLAVGQAEYHKYTEVCEAFSS